MKQSKCNCLGQLLFSTDAISFFHGMPGDRKHSIALLSDCYTFINNLSITGTCGPSPPNILHPRLSSSVLSFFSFGSLRSLGSLLSFRTRRAWKRCVCARLSWFPCGEKRYTRMCHHHLLCADGKSCNGAVFHGHKQKERRGGCLTRCETNF